MISEPNQIDVRHNDLLMSNENDIFKYLRNLSSQKIYYEIY